MVHMCLCPYLCALWAGKTFADVRRSFRDCVVVGYMRGTEAIFDPAESQVGDTHTHTRTQTHTHTGRQAHTCRHAHRGYL